MKKNEKILRIFAPYIPIPKGRGFTVLLGKFEVEHQG
jgi:hypothetical protein